MPTDTATPPRPSRRDAAPWPDLIHVGWYDLPGDLIAADSPDFDSTWLPVAGPTVTALLRHLHRTTPPGNPVPRDLAALAQACGVNQAKIVNALRRALQFGLVERPAPNLLLLRVGGVPRRHR